HPSTSRPSLGVRNPLAHGPAVASSHPSLASLGPPPPRPPTAPAPLASSAPPSLARKGLAHGVLPAPAPAAARIAPASASTSASASAVASRARGGSHVVGSRVVPRAASTSCLPRQNPPPIRPNNVDDDDARCVACGYPGADLRVRCRGKCAYHARCVDLVGLSSFARSHGHANSIGGQRGGDDDVVVASCPHCAGPADGLEMVPLSYVELDLAQRQARSAHGSPGALTGAGGGPSDSMDSSNHGKKRSGGDLLRGIEPAASSSYPSNVGKACQAANAGSASQLPQQAMHAGSSGGGSGGVTSTSRCYDPSVPRTGRWTDEELAFYDATVSKFLDGSLPLAGGSKLNDFLAAMLKSKQSRLTKKMKHAKLSSHYFRVKAGFVTPASEAREFSELEHQFVCAIVDPVERSEVRFHMRREWRERLAERLSYLRLRFDASAWLRSVDVADRRCAAERGRKRTAKRRCLMGRAMERDAGGAMPGVFIDRSFEEEGGAEPGRSPFLSPSVLTHNPCVSGCRFLMSMLDDPPSSTPIPAQLGAAAVAPPPKTSARSSHRDPNFRYAAPFLAGIVSYIERNGVPFEHVDVWVPSAVPKELSSDRAATPVTGTFGSGSGTNLAGMDNDGPNGGGACRLCFAGSATLPMQVVDEPVRPETSGGGGGGGGGRAVAPLASDELYHLSLFGSYSEKFSFNPGCGLPGRVHASGVAAWEQYLANAPPEMFERRGGAAEFGIQTALGLPIDSPTAGRIVVVLYSRHDRPKDEDLVGRMVRDVKLFHPCPRWKLVVDVRPGDGGERGGENPAMLAPRQVPPGSQPYSVAAARAPSGGMTASASFSAGMSALSMRHRTSPPGVGLGEGAAQHASNVSAAVEADTNKKVQISGLVSLLQENIPLDADASALGGRINGMMSLRMLLLRPHCSPEEEQLVGTLLVLYESYVAAGRTRPDIALLVTRDYEFHMRHQAAVGHGGGGGDHHHQVLGAPPAPPVPGHMKMVPSLPQQPQQQPPRVIHCQPGSFLPMSPFPMPAACPAPGLQNMIHRHPFAPPLQPMDISPSASGPPAPSHGAGGLQ
ncbi:hypothetical protein ACHAWF_007004, partial [Thalassiosira exigua]